MFYVYFLSNMRLGVGRMVFYRALVRLIAGFLGSVERSMLRFGL